MDKSPLISGIAATLLVAGAMLFIAVIWSDALVGAPRVAERGVTLRPHPGGASCSSRAWPFYETDCLRDLRRPDGRARAVRIVSVGSSGGHIEDVK